MQIKVIKVIKVIGNATDQNHQKRNIEAESVVYDQNNPTDIASITMVTEQVHEYTSSLLAFGSVPKLKGDSYTVILRTNKVNAEEYA